MAPISVLEAFRSDKGWNEGNHVLPLIITSFAHVLLRVRGEKLNVLSGYVLSRSIQRSKDDNDEMQMLSTQWLHRDTGAHARLYISITYYSERGTGVVDIRTKKTPWPLE